MAKKKQSSSPENLPEELRCIETARQLTLNWAKASRINLLRMELVTSSLLTNKMFSVWSFFDTDRQLKEYEADGTLQKIRDKYSDSLKALNCPDEYLAGILFFEDTDENVEGYINLKPIDF